MKVPHEVINIPKKAIQDRPPTSMRVNLSIGSDANDRLDRLCRALSTYQPGGVSRSAVIRGLLTLAESSGLMAKDERILMLAEREGGGVSHNPHIEGLDAEALWRAIAGTILNGR